MTGAMARFQGQHYGDFMVEPSSQIHPDAHEAALQETPLSAAHRALGAKMVPFAGYLMPVQYPLGVLGEHNWTRSHAGLFDVSHMGQCFVHGATWQETAAFLETLVPADIAGLHQGQQRYSQFLTADGGVMDDLMITRSSYEGYESWAYIVVNAGCKISDYEHIAAHLPPHIQFMIADDLALLALQGPEAALVLGQWVPQVLTMPFMSGLCVEIDGITLHVSRSGYTGEDGFELSIENEHVATIWAKLLTDERVKPIGLGARDSLRLEAGLCLYGHELDTTTSPVEAGLMWSIQKRRRVEGGFLGAARVQQELASGVTRRRVGLLPEGRAPARDGTLILDAHTGREVGIVTSGGFGPSLNAPLAMGYVEEAFSRPQTALHLLVRGKPLPARVVSLPFIPNRFYRSPPL